MRASDYAAVLLDLSHERLAGKVDEATFEKRGADIWTRAIDDGYYDGVARILPSLIPKGNPLPKAPSDPYHAHQRALVEKFNNEHPVGTEVRIWPAGPPGQGPSIDTETTSSAITIGGRACVLTAGYGGWVPFGSVEILADL